MSTNENTSEEDYVALCELFPKTTALPSFLQMLKGRLQNNMQAVRQLEELGVQVSTQDHFHLGLATPYENRVGNIEENSVVAPLRNSSGLPLNKSIRVNLPGVTTYPQDEQFWIKSSDVLTYISDSIAGKSILVICDSPLEVWRLWQTTRSSVQSHKFLFISSTDPHIFGDGWKAFNSEMWEKAFYVGDVTRIEKLAWALNGKQFQHIQPASGASWQEWILGGAKGEDFDALIRENADSKPQEIILDDQSQICDVAENLAKSSLERLSHSPININGAFHGGHLYYPVQTLTRKEHRTADGKVEFEEKVEVVVVKSDKTLQTVDSSHSGYRRGRVLRLTDGTPLEEAPKPNPYATWSWESIQCYLAGESLVLSLSEILLSIQLHLKQHIWLPNAEDYTVLALVCAATYVQAIFDVVPLILVQGPPASAKSELGRIMAQICANAQVIGRASPAVIERQINLSRGFIVLDDLEAVGTRGGSIFKFSELVQSLKLSYSKATGVRIVNDARRGELVKINFFGIKMINNTRGVDGILGSRMLRIWTKELSEQGKEVLTQAREQERIDTSKLRDELHTWAFENVSLVKKGYDEISNAVKTREDEILIPLRVIANLAADAQILSDLQTFALKQNEITLSIPVIEKVALEIADRLVGREYELVSTTHFRMEVLAQIEERWGWLTREKTEKIVTPEWMGLRCQKLKIFRKGMLRRNFLNRVFRLFYLRNAITENGHDPFTFCIKQSSCGNCRLRPFCNFSQEKTSLSP